MQISDLPQDKVKHFVGGIVIGVVLGLQAAVVIGAAKEVIYDKALGKGTPEFYDFLATAVGGAIGALIRQQLGF